MNQESNGNVETLFNSWARSGRADTMAAGHALNARAAFSCFTWNAGDRYLDLGCGNGYSVRWAAERGPDIQAIGIDGAGEMIHHARQLSADHKNARFIHARFPVPELREKTFDKIFTMEVLYYMEDLDWALLNVRRLLKPGGHLISVIDFYEENPSSHDWPEKVGVPMHLLSAPQWKAAFENAGLQVLQMQRLRHPLEDGEKPSWQHEEGSLMMELTRVD